MFHILKRLKISLEDDDVSRVCLKQGIPTWIRNCNLEFGIWNSESGIRKWDQLHWLKGTKMSEDDGEVSGICIHKYSNTTSRER